MSARRRRHALRQLQREISQRSPENLIPLSSAGYPAELLPVVAASNDLLTRLGAAYAAQQRLQAEAAHELRTPLTALRLHAQLAAGETEPQTRDAALQQVQMAVDRANGTVSRAESVRSFRIIPGDFTEANGYLTPSLKLKRKEIMRDFEGDVEAIYS